MNSLPYAILKERFPHASENFLRANASDAKRQVRRVNERGAAPRVVMDAKANMSVVKQDDSRSLDAASPMEGGGEGSPAQRPKCHVTLFRVSLLDAEAKWGACKYLIDAMRQANLIPNDRECDIELIVTQTKVSRYELEGTGVEITYPKRP